MSLSTHIMSGTTVADFREELIMFTIDSMKDEATATS